MSSVSQYDWRNFSRVFYPQKPSLTTVEKNTPGVVISEGKKIVAVYSGTEDLREWVGRETTEYKDLFSNSRTVFIDREEADQWLLETRKIPFFFDQMGWIRKRHEETIPQESLCFEHFLFQLIKSRWNRFFPSHYGVYVRILGTEPKSLLMIVQNGQLELVQEPSFHSLSEESRRRPLDLVHHLSERYAVPVQGLIFHEEDWVVWCTQPEPWMEIWKALKTKRWEMVPFRWFGVVILFLRTYLGL